MKLFLGISILIFIRSKSRVVGADLKPIIAIDLGNTYSSVGVFQNGNVVIIPDKQGNKLIPSYVAFKTNGETLVGEAAKNQQITNANNTIYAFKTLIGRFWNDKIVQNYQKTMSFRIFDDNNIPKFEVNVDQEIKRYSIVNITSLFISELKRMAEFHFGQTVENAVVSIPTYFEPHQREAIREAAQLSGLNVIRWIREAETVAIAYKMVENSANKNTLVYHLGGETFDATLLSFENGVFEVLANKNDPHLGGRKFNERIAKMLIDHCADVLGPEFNNNINAKEAMYQEIERAKTSLSTSDRTIIDFNFEDFRCNFALFRDQFEAINMDLFNKTVEHVEQVLNDAFLNKTDIHDIILIGGSTRIPKIRTLLNKYFDGKPFVSGLEPDLAVVRGAVMKAESIQIPEQKSMMESFVHTIVDTFFGGSQRKDELK
ncbi:hypothetical protein CAEBREN_08843 [Caenorhabditis brenneri]|uniref:Uncharacterized protein n=1 Tax=Caenorhabditis brenneri TaxID=135651 RepID=G0MBA8_CAEBE|nr:hypothetical protein CAEBREN_08843 [Caenorhabditis brenneri]